MMLICTAGDPFSVNVEVLNKIFPGAENLPFPLVICGSYWHWQHQTEKLFSGDYDHRRNFTKIKHFTAATENKFYFLDVEGEQKPADKLSEFEQGRIAVESLNCLRQVPRSVGKLAVLTAPINKHACKSYGFSYPGQTEFFEDLWDESAIMILAGPKLRVGLVTTHIPISELPDACRNGQISLKVRLFTESLKKTFGIENPRVAVCGLNPHCGEKGSCGREEIDIIGPALTDIRHQLPDCEISGPLPADTVFWSALNGRFDGVLAMYHDQGLGPLKTVHFHDAINISGGLPHLRVSPDHGPASDLYLKNSANTESFREAYKICLKYLAV